MILYKYVVPERIDILQNRKIRFSQVEALNDPNEGWVSVDDDFARDFVDSNIYPLLDLRSDEDAILDFLKWQYANTDAYYKSRMSLDKLIEWERSILTNGKLKKIAAKVNKEVREDISSHRERILQAF